MQCVRIFNLSAFSDICNNFSLRSIYLQHRNIKMKRLSSGKLTAAVIKQERHHQTMNFSNSHYKWVPVTTAWRILMLRMEERPPIWRVAANVLKKQLWTAENSMSSSLGVGRGANNSSP
jgi:hypothetical protein